MNSIVFVDFICSQVYVCMYARVSHKATESEAHSGMVKFHLKNKSKSTCLLAPVQFNGSLAAPLALV